MTHEDIKKFLVELRDLHHTRSRDLGIGMPDIDDDRLLDSPLAASLRIIARAADGEIAMQDRAEVHDHAQRVTEHLYATPDTYVIPDEFWRTPIGWACLQANIWAHGDELLTVSEAAEISGKSIQSISQMLTRGRLTRYTDPAASNPQHASRVLRSEIENL